MKLNLIGQRFGRLRIAETALPGILPSGRRYVRWRAVCDCGAETIVNTAHLRSGQTQSCGCLRRDNVIAPNTSHGEAKHGNRSAEYRIWLAMKSRCQNPGHSRYADYGGRGIIVCDRWRDDFEAFLADMGRRPTPTHTIERKDNDGNYEPGNCCWATRNDQRKNQRPRRQFVTAERRSELAQSASNARWGRVRRENL